MENHKVLCQLSYLHSRLDLCPSFRVLMSSLKKSETPPGIEPDLLACEAITLICRPTGRGCRQRNFECATVTLQRLNPTMTAHGGTERRRDGRRKLGEQESNLRLSFHRR